MSWVGEPGSWRPGDDPGPPKPRKPEPKPAPPPAPPREPDWFDHVMDELDKPGGGLFGRRAVTAFVAVAVVFLLTMRSDPTISTIGAMALSLPGGLIYTFWPLVSGSWWEDRS